MLRKKIILILMLVVGCAVSWNSLGWTKTATESVETYRQKALKEFKKSKTVKTNKTVNANDRIAQAFYQGESDFWVESSGIVEKVLPDDLHGDPHQKFILRLSNGHTLMIAHNIALAPRIEGLKKGDKVKFKGEYEWNAKGGVVHWTHHDPQGRPQEGWLEYQGKRYE